MRPRLILPRSTNLISLVDTFVIATVASLMSVRLYLFMAGYPKVGGGGLHVAHMIWGALLMLAALIVAISFVSLRAQRLTALLGGLGFGLLIDEIGKFLTSDNNYFFRPAAALIYAIVVVLFLLGRTLTRRRDFSHEEYLVNSLDLLKEAALQDFDQIERRKLLRLLRQAGDSTLAVGVRELVARLDEPKTPSPLQRLNRGLDIRYARMARTSWFAPALFALVVFGSFVAIGSTLIVLALREGASFTRPLGAMDPVGWIELGAAWSSLVLALFAVVRGIRKAPGLRAMERSVLVWILLVQPFAFYEAQFYASAGLLLSLPLLAVLQYALTQEGRAAA